MTLVQFNQLQAHLATQVLLSCVPLTTWSKQLLAGRPYQDCEQLYQAAYMLAQQWQWPELWTALAHHPRLGEQTAAQPLSEQALQFSQYEQARFSAQLHADTSQTISEHNALQQVILLAHQAYENKFGHIFLIRASQRSAAEILAELQRRLKHDVITEQQEIKQQLIEITLIRLKQVVR
ncbi:2-oxo-4-hydroxy-4-carboxy-5-ureidoimidazoline decarboxylase [Acinetobacter larvae]|uniref:2-oxo-4-hydroxy-4-carboxy-5-ureidoimidazoline decarboxylase n=1 Tax=Acinetobacter larvae TaxID=1789224 RepID=A0A1B2LYR2_9GAMM|nr:2-oxo-4-hydroxy-4-carboxy-5-ureidoimidazoline decarboxylase [Acinetobacter larvae]AOA58080.1 hypothetical protein BFG52_06750 [Acinetobacter larvae]